MPELPDIVVYAESIADRACGARLNGIDIANPFLLRTVSPAVGEFSGRRLVAVSRLGKRVVLEFEGELFAVIHLMIAGRFRWFAPGAKGAAGKVLLARFAFETGTLGLTEAGTRRRASLHLVVGRAALQAHDPGGLDPLTAGESEFIAALTRENHTLKRALTDPALFSGIGNAYSDEILHRARLSPLQLTRNLDAAACTAVRRATCEVLGEWLVRLRREAGEGFPEKVTAFRPEMAVHGKFKAPCPDCGAPVQRIVYAENECNYCATCQTGGRLLADRALSRLLKASWPKTLEAD